MLVDGWYDEDGFGLYHICLHLDSSSENDEVQEEDQDDEDYLDDPTVMINDLENSNSNNKEKSEHLKESLTDIDYLASQNKGFIN